jgi:hypothetical protein
MATIKKSDIYDGNTSKAEHITRIIDSMDGTTATDIIFKGAVTGSSMTTLNGQTIITSDELNIVAGVNSGVNLAGAGKTSGAGFVLPLFQPTDPVQGSAYFDGTSQLFIFNGSDWLSVTLSA